MSKDQVTAKLKPCPFCGVTPELEDGGDRPWVVCCYNPGCDVVCQMDGADTKREAMKAWNTRTALTNTEALQSSELERMREALCYAQQCFEAAETEGLSLRLQEADPAANPGSLADLVFRHLLYAEHAINAALSSTP